MESVADAGHAVKVLLDQGCEKVIITMGSQGAVYGTRECLEPCHVLAEAVTPIDTTVSYCRHMQRVLAAVKLNCGCLICLV